MQILSQRDPRWGNIKLGTSNTYIKDFGCTITCIAMIIGTTPDVVNERMKAVSGFANGNLVIWDKVKEAFPGIQLRRVWSYDNADVLANVPNVLVEVPGAPIGGTGKHWVVYVGNKKLYDPWTGTERPTSDFAGSSGYAVVSGKWNNPTSSDDMTLPKKTFEELVGKSTKYDEFKSAGFDSVDKVKNELSSKQSTIDNLNQQINDRNNDIVQLNAKLSTLDQKVLDLTQRAFSLEEQAKKVPTLESEVSALNDKIKTYQVAEQSWIKARKEYEKQIDILTDSAINALFRKILEKLKLA